MARTMTVAQLSAYLRGVFDDEELLHDVTLCGEVTEVSYSDRHTFITLAEGAYSVRCIHFNARDPIEKGAKLALGGTVSFYDKRNSVSFNYREYHAQGIGDRIAKLNALKEKLRGQGLFDNRPQLPKYIVDTVAVTSADGAAVRDYIRVVRDKCPFVRIRVCPVKVQGDGAAAMMASAINALQTVKTDVIVLCRGGGSDEDLDAFNDEALATAVANSRIPVISAVGHEINYSLCDFGAGTRAGTPSMAGEIVCAHALALVADLAEAANAAKDALDRRFDRAAVKIARLGSATTQAAMRRVTDGLHAVKLANSNAYRIVRGKLEKDRAKLLALCSRLRSAVAAKYAASRAEADRTILSLIHEIICCKKQERLESVKNIRTAWRYGYIFIQAEINPQP